MMSSKNKKNKKYNYYEKIDIIRALSCISILLYHMNILKGGYLAVCIFFVLTGYLSVISAFKKENTSFKEYYLGKIKRIYLPLLIVVFISITIISFIKMINWYNLKPETISVLLGYNNYWQISANLDYFTRTITSPFTHLWFMAIIIEFYVVFPFLFIILKKIGDKVKKYFPCIILGILGLASYAFFYKEIISGNITYAYYSTFTRMFSLLFGMLLGFIHSYYHPLISKRIKDKKIFEIIFYTYLIIEIILFYIINSSSKYFSIAMLITSIISIRLIDYATKLHKNNNTVLNKIIKYISNISYEIYLIQYPIIFIFKSITLNNYFKIPLEIIVIFLISSLIHYILNTKKDQAKHNAFRIVGYIFIIIPTLFGVYKFIISKDHTEEMKSLEKELNENKLLVQKKQDEYIKKTAENQNKWQEILTNFDLEENNLKEVVKNLPVVGIGDSIMLGAVNSLHNQFPNGYFDAAISRTDWEANSVLQNLINRGMLGDIIIFNLGTNGECPESCKNEIFKTVGSRKLFWVNATKPDYPIFNTHLKNMSETHDNIYIVDWISASNNHPEYFVADGIHLTKAGGEAYAKVIYDTIYNYYLDELKKKKEVAIKEHTEEEENKISFIGNDLLLNAFAYLKEEYNDSEYIIDSSFTPNKLKDTLKNKNMSHNIVLLFDNSISLTKEDYLDIIKLCQNHNVYIVTMSDTFDINNENIKIIDFYQEINKHDDYLMVDKIHLSETGNKALLNILKNNINNKK